MVLKVLVTGSRGWSDYQAVEDALSNVPNPSGLPVLVIHGGARGADDMAHRAAYKLAYYRVVYTANWKLYGKAAGMIRNREMVQKSTPDLALAFWDGESKGTAGMLEVLRFAKIPVTIFNSREMRKAA